MDASDESGQFQLYLTPLEGPGRKSQVSTDCGTQPVWSRNGKELFYRVGTKTVVVAVTTTATEVRIGPKRWYPRASTRSALLLRWRIMTSAPMGSSS